MEEGEELVNLPRVETLRTSSSPPLSLAPSSVLFCPSVSKFVDVAGPWRLFFFLNFTEHASSSETEHDFLFSKHFPHRHLNIFLYYLGLMYTFFFNLLPSCNPFFRLFFFFTDIITPSSLLSVPVV